MCLLRQFGEKAMKLMLDEIENEPTLYPLTSKPYRDNVAWGKVLENVQKRYPGVTDKIAWRSWYCFRYNYDRNTCSRKWRHKLSFVDDDFNMNSPSTARKRCRSSTDNEEEINLPVQPRLKYVKDEEDEEFDSCSPSQQMYPQDEDCFDSSYKKRHDVIKRNPHAVASNCLLRKYGDEAMEFLIDEVSKHPTLYPLCSKPYRDSVAWGKVLEAIRVHYPGVTDKEAWRSWYCFRYNYYRKSCSQRWKKRMSYVDLAPPKITYHKSRNGGPKVHKFTGGNPLALLQQYRPTDHRDKAAKFDDGEGNKDDSSGYGSFNGNNGYDPDGFSGYGEEYSGFEDEDPTAVDPADESQEMSQFSHIIGAAPKTSAPQLTHPAAPKIMRLFRKPPTQGQKANPVVIRRLPASQPGTSMTLADVLKAHSAQPGLGVRTIRLVRGNSTRVLTTARPQNVITPGQNGSVTVPITIDDNEVKPVISSPTKLVTVKSEPVIEAKPSSSATMNAFFRTNLRKKWIELEAMEDGKKHISALKKGIMKVLNNAFAEV